MRPFENESELATALRESREEPRPEFAAELDERVAAGFPRASAWRAALGRARDRVASTPPRRLLAPAGALALTVVVVATAVVATTDIGDSTSQNLSAPSDAASAGGGEASPARSRAAESAAEDSPDTYSGPALADPASPASAAGGSGPYAADAGRRRVERSAEIVLGAGAGQVRGDADRVFAAVRAADGIVLDSSIRDGDRAAADFDLLIPSDRLGGALATISRIGEVRSRHEATRDITAPTVRTGERLQDTRARIEGLLGQLADATDQEERAAVEARLRAERRRAAALRSRLSSLRRSGNFSRVSVRIESGGSSGGGGGAWGVGDGIDGAARVLAAAGGVAVFGIALLAPFALLVLTAWLSRRAWLRRSRHAALDRA